MALGFESAAGAEWGMLLPSLRGPASALFAAPAKDAETGAVDGGEVERDREAMERAGGLAWRIAGLAGRQQRARRVLDATHDGLAAASRASLSLLRVFPVDASLLCVLWLPMLELTCIAVAPRPAPLSRRPSEDVERWWRGTGSAVAAAMERERRLVAASDWLMTEEMGQRRPTRYSLLIISQNFSRPDSLFRLSA